MNQNSKIIEFPLTDEQKARINYLFGRGYLKWDLIKQEFEKAPEVNCRVELN